MPGVLLTFLFVIGSIGVGKLLVSRWTQTEDPSTRLAIWGLVGLGAIGVLTLFLGLLPGGFKWGLGVVGLLSGFGLVELVRSWQTTVGRPSKPEGLCLLALVAVGAAVLLAMISVIVPSDANDWDTLAYHLAVPKVWLNQGQWSFISFDHHSNFPFTINNLYIWGLAWGGQAGAKAFSLAFLCLGAFALFGLARERYGDKAAYWVVALYSGVPVIVWEAGTAYIDLGNGLFGALGIIFAAKYLESTNKSHLILSGIMLGLCAGSKYTGLQTVIFSCLLLLVFGLKRQGAGPAIKSAFLAGIVAMAVCCPWYVKNVVTTGNPVYPFFYKHFGGKNWSEFNDRIYTEEQQSFGVARSTDGNYTTNPIEISRAGSAILGLAYQPGRYTNPGQTMGLGFVFISLGAVPMVGLLGWLLSGRAKPFEAFCASTTLVSLFLWFFMSEQSRYVLGLMLPMILLFGGLTVTGKLRQAYAGLGAVSTAVGLVVIYLSVTQDKIPVAVGKITEADYLTQRVPFYAPAQMLNESVKEGRVALFDEVFGFYLDVPYFWANPGHTTELGYDQMRNADDFSKALKDHGLTTVYFNARQAFFGQPKEFETWVGASGLSGTAVPYEPADRVERFKDLRNKYKVLLAEAVQQSKLVLVKTFGKNLVFTVK